MLLPSWFVWECNQMPYIKMQQDEFLKIVFVKYDIAFLEASI